LNQNTKMSKNQIALSKALSWVLRHGAPSLGLKMTTDGYIPVYAILSCGVRKLENYNLEDVRKVVESNDKQRFNLCMRKIRRAKNSRSYSFVVTSDEDDDCGSELVPCIRANQGHSIRNIVTEDLLTPIPPEELEKLHTIVHGTYKSAWHQHICQEGLNRMKRNHIHFAPGLPQSESRVISGMRKNCEIYIFINGAKCAKDDLKFYRSANGVILTPGARTDGTLPIEYFSSVIDVKTGDELLGKIEAKDTVRTVNDTFKDDKQIRKTVETRHGKRASASNYKRRNVN